MDSPLTIGLIGVVLGFVAAMLLACGRSIVLWIRPRYQITHVRPIESGLQVVATEIRLGRRRTLSAAGSVTTWRDTNGHEIRQRDQLEYLYALWLRHRP